MKFKRNFTLEINQNNKTETKLLNCLEIFEEKENICIVGKKDNKIVIKINDFDTKEEAENWIKELATFVENADMLGEGDLTITINIKNKLEGNKNDK